MSDIATIMRTSAVLPVLVIHDVAQARPLAEALVAGGLRVIEVMMRTPGALEAIEEMRLVPHAVVGAGTVLTAKQFKQARDAGASSLSRPDLRSGWVRRSSRAACPTYPESRPPVTSCAGSIWG